MSQSLVAYIHQLGTMIKAGIPIDRALEFLGAGSDRRLNGVFADCARQVSRGSPLSQAVREHPRVFPAIFAPLIQAGESSGSLVEVLSRLVASMEQRLRYGHRLRSALTYPIVLCLVSSALLGILAMAVVPAMRPFFEQLQVPLPWITRLVLAAAAFFQKPGVLLLVFMVVATAGVLVHQILEGSPDSEFRTWLDGVMLKIPLIGPALHWEISARVCSCLGMMLCSGLPLESSLRGLGEVTGNAWVGQRYHQAGKDILDGYDFSLAMVGLLPPLAVAMISNAEQTGKMGETLLSISQMLDEQFEQHCDFLTALLEPLFLAITSLVVGVVSLAALLPWIQLLSQLG